MLQSRNRPIFRPVAYLLAGLLCLFYWFVASSSSLQADEKRPNVVLIMTDDQGYGDLGCHGNPVIQTPALDDLHDRSVRLTDFHVDPTCSPTRSALMTGRYSTRTGVWHTIMGRSLMHEDEVTLAEVFSQGGYRTAIFGKWHLGDNYPFRPQDQGFDEVLIHGGGGITQTPDFWGNDYFDDTYWHNGTPEKFTGYCTDVFFDHAIKFIEKNQDRPFFAYLPTNAAHGPFNVADKYSEPYLEQGIPNRRARFWGMVTNIDENVDRLLQRLKELDLEEETIFIFMTDNGTAAGVDGQGGFNAGMRGRKGSEYEGGHRVPCFIRWKGQFEHGRDVDELTAHIDLLPTLAELCNLQKPEGVDIDGKSLVPLLKGREESWPERTLFVHSQRIETPKKWRKSAVMTERWRLINGKELYDIQADPGQKQNIAGKHQDVVGRLRKEYDGWWKHISDRFGEYCRIELGAAEANPTTLTCHDWHAPQRDVPWNQRQIQRDPEANGYWAVEIVQDGRYRFTLRSRPEGVDYKLPEGTARLQVGDVKASAPMKKGVSQVSLEADLKAGDALLQTWLEGKDGSSRGAFFVEVERLE